MTLTVPALVPRKRKTLALPESPPGDKPPAKKRKRYDPRPGTVQRGMTIRLYPRTVSNEAAAEWERQTRIFDLWRRRTRELWNLLLGMEQAAYSGATHEPHLGWRRIWAHAAETNYQLARERHERRIEAGEEVGTEPRPPPIDKILARRLKGEEPKLFIWQNDLQKLMALLKQVPHTAWIGELPSHACQHVVKDLIKALQAMLKGKQKRAAGTSDRRVGFPRFKKNRYASGSVYFANTQVKWDIAGGRVKFPGEVGWVTFEAGARARKLALIPGQAIAAREGDATLARTGEDKFLGARLWRRGEDWWLSAQFESLAPKVPRHTGRQIGVKVAASTLATIYDGRSFIEVQSLPDPEHRNHWHRKRTRAIDAQAARKRKIAARSAARRQARGLDPLQASQKGRGVRLPRSGQFFEACARIATEEAHQTARRNDRLHKTSRRIVQMADHITIERVDVAGMMEKKADHRSMKRQRRREAARKGAATAASAPDATTGKSPEGTAAAIRHKAPPRVLRKALRRAAVAKFLGYIDYKGKEAARTITEGHMLDPRVQKCANCGTLNALMKDGRATHQCAGCGKVMRRQLNAAENQYESGKASRKSGLEAAE